MIQTYTRLPRPATRRAVCDIAADIRRHMPTSGSTWTFCRCYVQAMGTLQTWDDRADQRERLVGIVTIPAMVAGMSAQEIGLRFLCNAGAWRGVEAKRIKDEIRRALKGEA